MLLKCDCGCGRELKRTYDKSGRKAGYQWVISQVNKQKRFYDDWCRGIWEEARKNELEEARNPSSVNGTKVIPFK